MNSSEMEAEIKRLREALLASMEEGLRMNKILMEMYQAEKEKPCRP